MIMNKRGRKLDNSHVFTLSGKKLEITDEYQYLGVKLRPSGSYSLAVQELTDKASRAWFGISNIIFKNKRMEIDRIFGLFDSLVTPVATYGSPLWLPFSIPSKRLENGTNVLDFWENLKCETIQQKCARIALSVNKKTSRLAVLGELGRYPLFIQSLAQCLNYKRSLQSRKSSNRLIFSAVKEMEHLNERKCESWLTRVSQIEKVLKIPQNLFFSKSSNKKILSILKSKFDVHFLEKIREIKLSKLDTHDHNKLRTYRTLKCSFTREPYVDIIRNRNQRCFLSRLRVSSHNLQIELGRYTRPITPVEQRTCRYCCRGPPPVPAPPGRPPPCPPALSPSTPAPPDTEFHFLVRCPMFAADRFCLFKRFETLFPNFATLSLDEKFSTLLCPTTAIATKLVNRFIKNMFANREKLDEMRQMGPLGCTNPN